LFSNVSKPSICPPVDSGVEYRDAVAKKG
jgi:hypothetical protein